MMLATVKPEGRSKKRRFPMSQSLIGERLGNDAGHRNCAGDVCRQIVFPPLRRWRRTRFVQSGAEQAQIQIRKLGRTIALIIDRFHLVLVGRACAAPTLAQSFVQAMLQIGRDFGGLGVRNRLVISRCAGRREAVAARSNAIGSLEKVRHCARLGLGAACRGGADRKSRV
jgi:hypothetical protein